MNSTFVPKFARLIREKKWDQLFSLTMDSSLLRNLLEAIESDIIPDKYLFRLLYNKQNRSIFNNNIVLLKRYFVKNLDDCGYHMVIAIVYLYYMSEENETFFAYHYPDYIFYNVENFTTILFQHFFDRVMKKLDYIKFFSNRSSMPLLLLNKRIFTNIELKNEITSGAWLCCHACSLIHESSGCSHFPKPYNLNHSRLCECKKHYF
jgi:hypothetical protein